MEDLIGSEDSELFHYKQTDIHSVALVHKDCCFFRLSELLELVEAAGEQPRLANKIRDIYTDSLFI